MDTSPNENPIKIFYSYAHEDERMRKKLEKHLTSLQRQGLIAGWHDSLISAGTQWEHEIDIHLNEAHIILLLVSDSFLASTYCYSIEMTRALERHEAGEARVIPIILRPVHWQNTPFTKLQVLPTNGKPIASSHWHNQDEAFNNVVEGIRNVINELDSQPPSTPKSLKPLTNNIPFPRNPLFTGREDILNRLHETLLGNKTAALTQPQAISGLGGIGKTQTAVEYAYRYHDEYKAILWVRADSREMLISDFVNIVGLLKLPEKNEQDQSKAVTALRCWLQDSTDWLLILDNADNLVMVGDFIPSMSRGHILLTTREQVTGALAQRIEMKTMKPEEGALFLLRRAKLLAPDAPPDSVSYADWTRAKTITQLMDGLPLALDQAAAYIEETDCGLAGYLKRYETRHAKLLSLRGRSAQDHHDPVTTTWSLSFEKVQKANPAAAELLRLCAFLHPDAIPEEIITEGAADLGPILEAAATDLIELDTAIGELRRFSLVRRDPDTQVLNIHRLVQAVLKDGMDEDTQRQWAERAVRAVNRLFPDVEFTNWQRCQMCLPHAQVCAELIEKWNMAFPEAAQLLGDAGYYLTESAQYEQAELLYQQALAIREKVLGPGHPDTARSFNNLGELYWYQGKYEQAELLYQQALTIREKVLGPEHADTAESLNNLAALYFSQGKYEQSEALLRRTVAICEKKLGPEHPDTARSLDNLADLYRKQGKYEQAEPPCQQALAIREKILGPDHPDTAMSLSSLALLYEIQGKYEQSEALLRRTVAIREEKLGSEHPYTAKSLDNLADLYRKQGKYEQAELPMQRALAIREKVLRPEHPDTLSSLNNLAELYESQGKHEQAEPLFQRVLAIQERMQKP